MSAPKIHPVTSALAALLPAGLEVVGHAETFDALALDVERELTGKMVASRRDEFLTGRSCARAALRRLGVPDSALVPGPDRAPRWPEGIVGSISHTAGFCLAAVGPADRFFAVGIDVEKRGAVGPHLESYVATEQEARVFGTLEDWRTIAFSAKESVFKAINPRTGIWLEFHDVVLTTLEEPRFVAEVTPKGKPAFGVTGGFALTDDFVVSAVVLAQRP